VITGGGLDLFDRKTETFVHYQHDATIRKALVTITRPNKLKLHA